MSKEELHENYAIIQGPEQILKQELNRSDSSDIIGYSRSAFGFHALVKNRGQVQARYQGALRYATPTLEDILIYHRKGEKDGSSYL